VTGSDEYCHFTKAVENIGDRWSIMVLGELERRGTLGFNELVRLLPNISRSVLADRLHRLGELGLIAQEPAERGRAGGWCVTPAGGQLRPVFDAIRDWALRWVPEDPAVAERDPDLIVWWLRHRVREPLTISGRVVIDLDIHGTRSGHFWLVLDRDAEPSVCLEDPRLAEDRYVYVEADAVDLYPIAHGDRAFGDALRRGDIHAVGNPQLLRKLPSWFEAVGQ
jgi:DNA-binding HxlR family transcriptional regulator